MRRIAVVTLLAFLSTACSVGGFEPSEIDLAPQRITVNVVDEQGVPVPEAVFRQVGGAETTAHEGTFTLSITDPRAGVVEAPGYLAEPLVVGGGEPELELTLWGERALDGTPRLAMHFAGDTMLGRRYLDPQRDEAPLVVRGDGGASAAAVVANVAPLFAAADVSMVNLETVLGDAPFEEAAPGKRFLLQSPPEATFALNALGVDVAVLGNNHLADWGDPGVQSTLDILAEAGINATGAGLDDESARVPAVIDVDGMRIGVLSYTTVTGSVANDALPTGDVRRPARLPATQSWQYDLRAVVPGIDAGDSRLPTGDHRAGDLWQWFQALPSELQDDASTWTALVTVFPELQDWVARRGHGGAARFQRDSVDADVADLRKDGADLVVVQLHGGYQFSEVGSTFFTRSAHAAVDAGADLVIGHHPHVLQGFEWYGGKLIAHSLGNFVFDQDFLTTFSSMMLRVVYEGDELIEARVLPVAIADYRPTFAAGPAARAILRELRADSTGIAPSEKIYGVVARNVDAPPGPNADLLVEGNSATVGAVVSSRTVELVPDDNGIARVPPDLLVSVAALPGATAVGRELLRWGSFDDVLADGSPRGANNWALDDSRRADTVPVDRSGHNLALRLAPTRTQSALVRPLARVPIPRQRILDDSGRWVDGTPDYAIRARIRREGPSEPTIRLDLYHFEDSDPLSDPESQLLRRVEIVIPLENLDDWQLIEALVPAGSFDPVDGVEPNAVMVYVSLASGTPTELLIDDLELIEWRQSADLPDELWIEADVIRSTAESVTLTVR